MSDASWQRLPKARRAAVYRAIGRAARVAREDGEREVAADVRIAIDVLRRHAKGRRRPTTPARSRKTTSTKRRTSR